MLKYLSLFSGIGAFEKALQRLNISFELVNYCEIDKYASKSYSLIHDISESKNLWDIQKVNEKELPNFDLMTWGFPCTSFSSLGKRNGFEDRKGNKTASGLYFDGMRILREKKPKYSIIENVKALCKPKFKNEFKKILKDLDESDYNSYCKILDAKNFNIPQKRERVFIVSIRKDIDKTFNFPEEVELKRTFDDLLDKEVNEKYFLKGRRLDWFIENLDEQLKKKYCSLSPNVNITLTGRQNLSWNRNHVEILYQEKNKHGQIRDGYNVYGVNGLCPTLKSSSSQRHEKIRVDEKKYRFLTPKETFRFMGFDDSDFKKVENKISDSQLYKQTGNSIVVNVLEGILRNLL